MRIDERIANGAEPAFSFEFFPPRTPEGEENLILIRVEYRIRANNAVQNLVYPFYVTEGGVS